MIKKAELNDINELVKLAIKLWEKSDGKDLYNEFKYLLTNKNNQIFIKYIENKAIGFAQCGMRYDYVEGTNTSPVGYLEGIYIDENYRLNGYAKELLTECEKWAKIKGCTEFASDCEIDNIQSLKFHLKVGFNESNRIICFTKKLNR